MKNRFNCQQIRLKSIFNPIKGLLVILLFIAATSVGASNDFKVLTSNNHELVLVCHPQLTGIDTVIATDGRMTLTPKFKESYNGSSIAGEPQVIYSGCNITVPSPTGFHLAGFSIKSTASISGIISPFPSLKTLQGDIIPTFTINDSLYNNFSNNNPVNLVYSGIAGRRHTASLRIAVASFDPLTQSIILPDEITVKIEFNSVSNSAVESGFGAIASLTDPDDYPSTINHKETSNWLIKPHKPAKHSDNATLDGITAASPCVIIKIDNEGVYRIDRSMLSSIGVEVPNNKVDNLRIYGTGGKILNERVTTYANNFPSSQPIIVNKNNDGSLNSIIFYAASTKGFTYSGNEFVRYFNYQSNSNYYMLSWDETTTGFRAIQRENPAGEATVKPEKYTHRYFFQEEMINPYPEPSGRYWFGRTIFPTTFTTVLHDLDRNDKVDYKIYFAEKGTDYAGNVDLLENNVTFGNFLVPPPAGEEIGYTTYKTSIDASKIATDNRSILKMDYTNKSAASAIPMFGYYEIDYRRPFLPIDGELSCYTIGDANPALAEYSVNGFTSSDIYGFDASDTKNPVLLKNMSSNPGVFKFKDSLLASKPCHYLISNNLRTPELRLASFSRLHENNPGADIVVVTNTALLEAAKKYKEYREKQNYKVMIATTEEIYNEFSSGNPDVTAIRDFIANAFYNYELKPRYLLVLGSGHYDFKNISTKVPIMVPIYENPDDKFQTINSYASDDFYAMLAGDDDKVDLAVGRLPVKDLTEANNIIDKIIYYETQSSTDAWRTNATFLADDSWKNANLGDGPEHTNDSETTAALFPNYIQNKKIYLVQYPVVYVPYGRRKPRANEEMMSEINTSGALILSWYGHGNPRVWAHEELLERDKMIPLMLNKSKLFFTTAATCDFGHIDIPETASGSDMLLTNPNGGAIGVLPATRSVYGFKNVQFMSIFYPYLLKQNTETGLYPTLGEAVMVTKRSIVYYDNNDKKFILLADPAMRLLLPENNVIIDSINQVCLAQYPDSVIMMKGLSTVSLAGRIVNPVTNVIDTTFNGIVTITMLDGGSRDTVYDYFDQSMHVINNSGPALNRSTYRVEKGKFTSEFILPKDIAFADAIGHIYAFASTPDRRFAKGFSRNVRVDGIENREKKDTTGPTISLYLDSRHFSAGDYVRKSPLLIVDLYDESGLNTTGRGIGHRIEAWIDNNPVATDLTSNFINSYSDSHAGSIEEVLYNMSVGTHTIKVRAWDVFNNFSVATTEFRVASESEGIIVEDVYVYPNPNQDQATFFFKHNAEPPYYVTIDIYSLEGMLVQTLEASMSNPLAGELPWNGKNSEGKSLSTGSYHFYVNIKPGSGYAGGKAGKFIRAD